MFRALAKNCDAKLNDKEGAEAKNWKDGKPLRVVSPCSFLEKRYVVRPKELIVGLMLTYET